MLTLDGIFLVVAIIMLVVQIVLLARTLYLLYKPRMGRFDLCLVKESRDNCRIWSVVITIVLGWLIAYRFEFIFIECVSAVMTLLIFLTGKIEEN